MSLENLERRPNDQIIEQGRSYPKVAMEWSTEAWIVIENFGIRHCFVDCQVYTDAIIVDWVTADNGTMDSRTSSWYVDVTRRPRRGLWLLKMPT